MFHSGSGTQVMLHRLRTTAPCPWLHVAPHSTLEGRRYRVELSIDPRFPKVPAAPGFPLQPSHVTVRSEAILCGTGCALTIRPRSRTGYRLSPSNRSSGHCLPDAVSASPNLDRRIAGRIGSKEGVTPSSAHRSRTSPIKGMQLQRLLDSRLATWNLPGWRPDMPFRACVFAVWRPAR